MDLLQALGTGPQLLWPSDALGPDYQYSDQCIFHLNFAAMLDRAVK